MKCGMASKRPEDHSSGCKLCRRWTFTSEKGTDAQRVWRDIVAAWERKDKIGRRAKKYRKCYVSVHWNKYNKRPSTRHLNQTRRPTFDVSLLIIIITICFSSTYKYYYYVYRKACLRRVAAADAVQTVEYRQRIAIHATLNINSITYYY